MTLHLFGDTYNFWKKAKKENQYAGEKQKIANQVIAEITAQIPEADGKIEICDVAPPSPTSVTAALGKAFGCLT